MPSDKAPTPAPASFDLEALRAVQEQLGAATRDDGEVFTFTPDPELVASWLQGGVPFGIPLGESPAILDGLDDDAGTLLGDEGKPADPLEVAEPEAHDVNEHFSHWLSIEADDEAIVSVNYTLHGWSYSDDAATLAQGKSQGFVGNDGAPLPRHDNTRFSAILAKVLPAAGFPLKTPPGRAGKKEREVDGGGVRVTWNRHRAESLFDSLELTVHAWRD